jgi:hypothetical protein
MFTTFSTRKTGEVWEDSTGKWTMCRQCSGAAHVINRRWDSPANGTIDFHSRPDTGSTCTGTGAAVDLDAALRRDDRLNPQEQAVHDRVFAWLISCKGFDSITGEICYHPICDVHRQAGREWTLMGWRTR